MYTEVKSYQLIISLLKQYGVKHCVLSAGSRNVPFVHSVEKDDYFKCYSVVDERSAGYFALGLAQELNEPVVISCTSSTATCNYWPAVAEAYYQGVPLIVLTSDRDPRMLGQWEDQMIDQVGMYDRHVKKSVNLPIVNNKNDEIFCVRLLNEALLELNHNGKTGPIHINVPTDTYNRTFNVSNLPIAKKINRIEIDNISLWDEMVEKLKKAQRIMVICGQKNQVSDKLKKGLEDFFKKYNSIIVVDYMSNVDIENSFNSVAFMDTNFINSDITNKVLPDIVISYGGQIFSSIKAELKNNCGKFEHWLINESGEIIDPFKSITNVFECKPELFFEKFNQNNLSKNNMNYYNIFKENSDKVVFPEIPYSHVYAIKNVVEKIKSNSILHLSINDSIRITNFFKINEKINTYANIGTHGIDGCLSSFLGQAVASPSKDAFLIIGDLAFFYDMNALRINSIPKKVHILLINNHGGSEFYYNHIWQDKYSDLHTSARHNVTAEGWVKSNSIKYITANDKESFDKNLDTFINSEEPILFEVFTEMKTDADTIHDILKYNRPKSLKSEVMRSAKEIVKKSFGQERTKKIIDAIKK